MKLLVFGLLIATTGAVNWKKYEGSKLIEVVPSDATQLQHLLDLMDNIEVDFWKDPKSVGHVVKIFVSAEGEQALTDDLQAAGMTPNVIVKDISKKTKNNMDRIKKKKKDRTSAGFDYDNFNTFEDIMTELDNLTASCPAGFTCTLSTIGSTYEGRPLKVLKVTSGQQKKAIWLDALIHAREWLPGATLLKIMNKMLRDYGTDPTATAMMDTFDWYFLPVMNPDGYVYTWTDERYWRKNRSPNSDAQCDGTDLNRNYDYGWGGPGASELECAMSYRGASAASELETQAVQNYGLSVAGDLLGWITMHSYGRYILYPYGDCTLPSDNDDIVANLGLMCSAVEGTSGETWTCGNSCQELYATSGTTMDWTRGAAGAKYSYNIEMRGDGFEVEPAEISTSFAEMWLGLVTFTSDAAVRQ